MIGTIILIWLILGVLDTLIGNRIFPGRVRAIKDHNSNERYPKYNVQKINRVMFIPITMWLAYEHAENRALLQFEGRSSAISFDKEVAIRKAKLYSNKLYSKGESITEVIWDSKTSTKVKKESNKEDILLLVPQLIEAVEKDNKPLELKILNKMNNLTNPK